MAAEGNGVQASRPVRFFRQSGGAHGGFAPQDLPREHDPRVEFLTEKGEVGEDGGEYSEEYSRPRRG